MTVSFERAVEKARALPPEAQDRLAEELVNRVDEFQQTSKAEFFRWLESDHNAFKGQGKNFREFVSSERENWRFGLDDTHDEP